MRIHADPDPQHCRGIFLHFLNDKKAEPDPNTHFLTVFWVRIWTGSGFNWFEYLDPNPDPGKQN
jgi:hypothetical protein